MAGAKSMNAHVLKFRTETRSINLINVFISKVTQQPSTSSLFSLICMRDGNGLLSLRN